MIRAKIATALSSIAIMVGLSFPSAVQAENLARYSLDGGATWTEVGAIIYAFDAVKGQTDDAIIEALANGTIMPYGSMSGAECNIILRSSTTGSDVYTLTRSSQWDGWTVPSGKTLTITNIILDGGSNAGRNLLIVNEGGTLRLETGAVVTSSHTGDSAGSAIKVSGDLYFEGGVVRGWRESSEPVVCISEKGTVYIHSGGIENCTQTSTSAGRASAIGGYNTSYFIDDSHANQRTVLYMTGGFIRNNIHTGVGTDFRGALSFDRAPIVEISGGEISGNTGADEYSCGIYMGKADWGKKGIARISGNPVIAGNTTGSGASCDIYVEEASRLVQTGNLISGANVGVYSASNYAQDATFGTLSTAGFTGAEYIHNDRDATLVGSADGTNLKWTTGSEDPEEPEEPEEPLPIYTLTIPAQDHLTVASVKTNNVTVTGSGNDYLVVSNTQVTINFTAASGYQITGGNPVVVTVESNMTLAQFPTVQQASTPDTPVWPDYVPCTPSNRYTIEGAIPVVKQLYTEQLNSLNDAHFPLPREFDLVTIGDSITDNWDTRDNANYFALAGENGAVFNLGIGGDRIEQLLWRLEEGGCNNFKAKYITLLIGTNNSYQRRMEEGVDPDRPEEMAKGIERVLWNLTTGHPEAKILLMPILPYEKLHDERGAVCRANNENVNDLIIKFVDNKQIFWLDIRGGFLNADGTFRDEYWSASGDAGSDGKGHYLHPSSAGYSQVFDPAVRAAMTKIDASVSADTAQETDPTLGYASASVDSWNAQVTMTLSGVYVGTDSSAVKASSYKIEYKLDDGGWTTACENQTLTRNTFVIENVAIGQHTCEIKVTTSAGKSVTTVSQFTMSDAWMAEALGATSASVRTEGDLVYAYAVDGNYTVAGVTFTKASGSVDDSNIKWPFGSTAGSTKPDGLESGGYADLLTHCWWMNPGTGGKQETITLKGLTVGNEYLVQLFSYRSAYNEGLLYVAGTQADTTFIRAGGDGWPYGGTLVGKFTAAATTKDIVIQIEGATALNGIQVRDLGSGEPIPVNPSVGSVSASISGSTATISLKNIVKGTDDEAVAATFYSVAYTLNGAAAVTALSNQSAATAEFSLTDLADGDYTCSVTITTDKGKTSVAKSVNFTIKTSTPGGDDDPDEPVELGWTVNAMTSSADLVLAKNGTFLYGYRGNSSALTVDEVTFAAGNDAANMNIAFDPAFGIDTNSGDQFGDLLQSAWKWANTESTVTLTMNGLTKDHVYLVQILAHNGWGNPTITVGDKTPVYIGEGAKAANIIGTFKATGSSADVELKFGGGAAWRMANAVQVRDLGAGGDDPESPTYAVSWTGGANATVAAKANGSMIDSGEKVGDGTNVVFTVTPDTGYEFAEASYQDWTKSGDALTRTVTVNGAAVSITIPNATEKTTPTPGPDVEYGWTGAKLLSDASLVKTDGTLLYAYARGNYTVNTVSFKGLTNSDFDWTQGNQPLVNDDFSIGIVASWTTNHDAPEGTSGDYANMLKNGWWLNGGTYPLILKNLTSGKDYLVQIFCYRSHSSYNAGHVTVDGETLQGESYITSGGEGWSNGGTIIGIFHADSETETVTIESTSQWCFNAIQVRELSGDEPTPTTYAVSWTGGVNASVVAEANGSAIDSGALVGDGTNVVFTVTPNTNYEFAEASYADWTKSGGALTRTVTVNGAAVNIEIPNATKKDIPVVVYGWKAEHLGTSETAIYTVGTKKYAYCSTQFGSLTVNTVPFDQKSDFPSGMSISVSNGEFFRSIDAITLPSGVASDSDYGKLLTSGYWGPNLSGNNDIVITFNGLVEGKDYLVQLISHSTLSGRNGQITVGGKTIDPAWDFGGSLVGVFKAEGSSQAFTFTFSDKSFINGLQVRELAEGEGAGIIDGGDDPTTYAVSWTGGANATVVAEANGAAINSGAKVGDGTNVVFTVTPNTDYEFAEASYEDWTKSGEALTRTVTVNGAAVDVTIPNATAKSGPTPAEGDWYVSPDGDDSNNGKSADTPYATIAKAVSSAANGDVICVLAGNYTVTSVIDVSKAITIKGEGWDKTIVNGGSNRMFALKNAAAKLEGMKLTGATANTRGAAVHMTDGTISWCYISGNTRSGTDYKGGAVSILKGTIDHSVFADNTSTMSGAAIGGSYPNGDILIDTCLVYGNGMASGSSGSGGIDFDNLNNVTCTIRNCTVVDNTSFGDFPAGIRVTGTGNVILINNIISGNIRDNSGKSELNLAVTRSLLDTTASRNCIITGTKDTDATYYRDAGAVSVISGSSAVVPTFVNVASGDYHLAEGSSAIAAGVTYTGIGVDLGGAAFAATPSVGCYEYSGDVPPAPTTYEVSWTGGANATVDAKANGATISSGALVGDGTNVVFTVTPNTDYEFAEASYQDWTKSGDVLTRTVTVNGAAVNITIPNATEKTTPPPGPTEAWTAVAMTAYPVSVLTDGVLVYAYAWKDCIANTVEFTGAKTVAGFDNENLSWTMAGNLVLDKPVEIKGVSDEGYRALLANTASCLGDPHRIVLKNLTPGHEYLVQIIGCNPTGDHDGQVTVVDYDNTVFMKSGGDGWPLGGSLIGDIVAESDMVEINLAYSGWSCFNAIQVRDLSLTDDDAVAIIERGSTTNYFFTIEDAYNGATEGETIKLVKDADFPANDPVFSKSVDIDLNGFSLTRSNLAHVKEITSDTAITNGAIAFDSGVYPSDTATPFLVGSGATLTLDTMNVGDANGHEPLCLISVEDGSHVVLSGEGTYHVGSLFNSVADGNTMTITGGRYILRGWFMPANRVYLFADYKKGNVSISGGAFSIAPDNSWIASGYRILHDISDPETPYHVVPASEAPYTESGWSYYYKDAAAAEAAHVAKRETAGGVKYYTSLRDAVSAANGSGTVTLVADIPALDRGVTLGGTVTLDGAGHKVSVAHPYVNDSGFVANDFSFNIINMISVYPKEADVTLRNISLTGGGLLDGELSNDGLAVVDNAGKLLMENVTVTRSNGAVYNEQTGVLYMDNCRLVRNCRYCAGGLFNVTGGFAVMNRSSLSENRSLGVTGGGGACENGGTLFVNNCVIVNNSSTEVGGAINNYASNHQPKLYMMNTTVSGNFSSIKDDTNAFEHDKGGAIGMRGETGAEFCAVNCLFSCNYQIDTRTDVAWGPITVSDMCSIDGGTAVKLYYSVYTGLKSMTPANTSTMEVRVINEYETSTNVFNAYFASPRVYQNAKPTAMAINGAQLVSKDDGSLDATLARYAPIKRTDNGDGTYDYGQAVYGTDGVYTYFDPSAWKNKSVAMSYAPVDTSKNAVDFFNYEAAGEMQTVDGLPNAGEEYMVTNYYESASGRSFGVAGASGWLKGDVTYYTVKLVAEPENGMVSGATINGETYEEGTVIQLTATPGYARDFLGWYEITDGGATTNFLSGSNKTVWELTVDHNYELLAKFSDLQEVLTPDPYVHVKMADDTEGPLLYPITMMTKWMRDHYENFEDTLAGKTKAEAEEWLTQILEQTSPGTGRKMWQDYVLGVDPNDADAKIWINSPQIRQEGQTAIRMEMNRLSPASGTKFTINYRLDKKLGDAATFARADVNGTGSYDVKVENDPTGLYVIDLLFIPEGKSTSEEYVTTVNTAGVLRVASGAVRSALSVPWMKLQPTGSSAVDAVDLVKTTNLSAGDVLYLYDVSVGKNGGYRAWEVNANGAWSSLNVFSVDDGGRVDWNRPANASGASSVVRGLGFWLERANTNDYIYLCGQYDPSSVKTTLAPGFNLVANPYVSAFDASELEEPVKTGDVGDRIVIPTAGAPINAYYKGDGWKWPSNSVITVENPVTHEQMTGTKTVWTSEGLSVPVGLGFWYFNAGSGPVELTWPAGE